MISVKKGKKKKKKEKKRNNKKQKKKRKTGNRFKSPLSPTTHSPITIISQIYSNNNID